MHRHLRHFAALALLALLLAAPGLALAHGEGPQQTVDGYTITLALPEKGFFTGRNPVAVSLWDWQGNTPETSVSVLPLAFTPAGNGHGDSHTEAAPAEDHTAAGDHGEATAAGDHAAAEDHATAGDHAAAEDHAAADDHAAAGDHAAADEHSEATEPEHAHNGASATEGQGLVAAPVALAASDELGEYRGELSFDQAGTYTLSVIFTVDGQERGAIFDLAVAQSRPRGLVLGGFALVNGLAVGAAGWLKYRNPQKAARKPARPAASVTPEE